MRNGFTLIEMMIVISIIAIIAAIAIPSILRSQISSNEISAVGTLRTMIASQAQFRGGDVVDQDRDGNGEYGFLQELAGTATPRTVAGQTPAHIRTGEYITQVLGIVYANGIAIRSGYHFYIYLPAAGGTNIGESNPLPAGDAANANDQEARFICYGWPAAFDSSGKRCFVVNQQGEVFAARNVSGGAAAYNGIISVPPASAAFLSTYATPDDLTGPFPRAAKGEVGDDGQIWRPAGS